MPKPSPVKIPWHKRWVFKSTLLLVLVVTFLGGVIGAGRWGLEQLRGRARYDVKFSDLDCEPPVGMERREFLTEVRAAAKLPEKIHLLDDEIETTLRDGFSKHPWVEKIEAVQITPPNHIFVSLRHRTPVLAVKVGNTLHAVDRHGILLPGNAPTLGLPVYVGVAPAPKGPPGTRWGDPNVEAAARMRKP
jgi:hypothetical protein